MKVIVHEDGSSDIKLDPFETSAFCALMAVAIDRGTVDAQYYMGIVDMYGEMGRALIVMMEESGRERRGTIPGS